MRIKLLPLISAIVFLFVACASPTSSSSKDTSAKTCTVTFDSQSATIAATPEKSTVTKPATTASLPNDPVKTDCIFGGWYTAKDGGGTAFTAATPVTSSITVYAKWVAVPKDIILTGPNGSVTVTNMSGHAVTLSYTPGAAIISANLYASAGNSAGLALANQSMTNSGGTWSWTFESDSYTGGVKICFDILINKDGVEINVPQGALGNMTTWASFTYSPVYSYTVNYDSQSATVEATPSSAVVSNPATTVGALPTEPAKTGFAFDGWFTAIEGGTAFLANTPVTGSQTVYARWASTKTWTVTFDGQSADTAAVPSSMVIRTGKTAGTLPVNPARAGYTFAGWYTEPLGAGTKFTAATVIAADRTVFAKWNEGETGDIFGSTVYVFDDSMPMADIQAQLDEIYANQRTAEFSSNRYAVMFKPGTYDVQINVAFYMQILGLGRSPDDVLINGAVQSDGSAEATGNHHVTQNFWRSVENLSIQPSAYGRNMWAVSQAAPARRLHVKGDLWLFDINPNNGASGWASGGFLGDSLVDGSVVPGGQQQWLSRNSNWAASTGGVWNMVFVGDNNAPATGFGAIPNYTTIDSTPVIKEKPYLYIDGSGKYQVFVPSLRSSSQGTSWASGPTAGTAHPISEFYIAKAATDTAGTLNAALQAGKNLLFTPGIYRLNDTIRVSRADTIVLGLGLATLQADSGVTALEVADVDGVEIAGFLIEAGSVNSDCLMRVGPSGSGGGHSANPTLLADLFFRIGGASVGKASLSLEINSDNVIGDDLWIWRADHGITTSTWGWTVNTADTGLVVNGDNVIIYGLAVEHFQKYQTIWKGNGGRVYFYQSEIPYDVPNQAAWMNGTEKGYASYKVADSVTSHTAYGVGVYCFFNVNPACQLENAIEVPASGINGAMFHDMVTVALGDGTVGQINHVINGKGDAVTKASAPTYLTE